MDNTPDSPAKSPVGYTTQGGNYWTLITLEIWKVLHAVLHVTAWQRLKQVLYAHDWVVYAKQPLGGPQAVLDYLGRYTHRVAISNERIVGIANDQVAFRVRADAEGRKRTLRLPGGELIARFCCTSCPAASSASGTMACSRRQERKSG